MAISEARQMELRAQIVKARRGATIKVDTKEEDDYVSTARAALIAKRSRGIGANEPVQAKVSDGSSADYYKLPRGAKQLQDLRSYRNMNFQIGEIFSAAYRYGVVPHSPPERDLKKIIYYAQAELARLKKYETVDVNELDVEDL